MWKLFYLLAISWCAVAVVPTDQERNDIVEEHATAREGVTPTATNMQLIRYSTELENLAQQWTNSCSNQAPNSTLFPNRTDVSLTWTSASDGKPTYYSVMVAFTLGKYYYTYENNSCKNNCRLYLQVVWANTTEVGCAMSPCNNIRPNSTKPVYLVACAYRPPGNIEGQRPYKNGTVCQDCPYDFWCYRNQCTNDTSLLPATTYAYDTETAETFDFF
uniref:SCP domain-containing protein n=1 Tax=Mesocestoides corti TaxID=53468 RepID=A0A5K3ER32_MESCO